MKLLDVGAGRASITASFARLYPKSQITALDISEEALEPGRHFIKSQGITNIGFAQGSVYSLSYADNTFDVVHASQVLTHLDQPVKAIREMIRVCRPGGVVSFREAIIPTTTVYPRDQSIDRWLDLLLKQIAVDGSGEVSSGARLREWCLAAGAAESEITSSAGTYCWTSPEDRTLIGSSWAERTTSSGFAKDVLSRGWSNEKELKAISDAWLEWAKKPDGWFGVMHGEAIVRAE